MRFSPFQRRGRKAKLSVKLNRVQGIYDDEVFCSSRAGWRKEFVLVMIKMDNDAQ
jgi:hypothetical protein